jgi:hypothetical protein
MRLALHRPLESAAFAVFEDFAESCRHDFAFIGLRRLAPSISKGENFSKNFEERLCEASQPSSQN